MLLLAGLLTFLLVGAAQFMFFGENYVSLQRKNVRHCRSREADIRRSFNM